METVGTGTGRFDWKLQIGSFVEKEFIFRTHNSTTDVFTDEDISDKTFSFSLRKYKGSRKKIINYTNNNGITIPIYYTNRILLRIQGADTEDLEEGEYYFEIRREDLDAPKVAGLAYLTFDAL